MPREVYTKRDKITAMRSILCYHKMTNYHIVLLCVIYTQVFSLSGHINAIQCVILYNYNTKKLCGFTIKFSQNIYKFTILFVVSIYDSTVLRMSRDTIKFIGR